MYGWFNTFSDFSISWCKYSSIKFVGYYIIIFIVNKINIILYFLLNTIPLLSLVILLLKLLTN